MSSVDVSGESESGTPPVRAGEMRLEVVFVPVSDVDRAKRFYEWLGWRLDAVLAVEDRYRVVQCRLPSATASSTSTSRSSSSIRLSSSTALQAAPTQRIDEIALFRGGRVRSGLVSLLSPAGGVV